MKSIFIFFLAFCGVLAAAERLATGIDSVQQLMNDGRVVVIAPGAGKKAPFLGGYLVSSSEKTMLFPCEPEPNFFNFSWEAKSICGTPDGVNFWCISRDQIGDVLFQNKLHCSGESGLLAPQFAGRRIFVGQCKDGTADVLVYQTGMLQRGWLKGMTFTAVQEIPLPGDTGVLPAVSADCEVFYYLHAETDQTVTLYRVDTQTAEVVSLENLGNRVELGIYAGEFRQNLQVVSCSEDGSVVAFHSVDGIRGLQLRMGTLRGDGVFVTQTVTVDGGRLPRLSANGRFLVYMAGSALWRYDSHSQKRQKIFGDASDVSGGVVLSPNGCWCAWVDDQGTLWRERFDAWIALDSRKVRVSSCAQDVEWGMKVFGATSANTITWKDAGDSALPIRFFSQTVGEEILPGIAYSVDTLPWVVKTEGQYGKGKIQFLLDNGDFDEMDLLVSDFISLTPWLDPGQGIDDFFYRSLHFPTEKSAALLTNAPLRPLEDGKNSVDGYLCDFVKEKYIRNLKDIEANDLVVCGGESVYRVCKSTGTLLRDETVLLADGVSAAEAPVLSQDGHLAVIREGALLYSCDNGENFSQVAENALNPRISADGMVLAWVSGNALYVRSGTNAEAHILREDVSALCGMTQNGEYFLFQNASNSSYAMLRCDKSGYVELTGIPANASNVILSANGRRVIFEAKLDEQDKTRVYCLDWKNGANASAVCLMPKAIQGAREAALSGTGRYVSFSTYADMEVEGTQLTENGQCNLYLWEDNAWKNAAPVILNAQLAGVQEDSADVDLQLSTMDSDGDATVTTIVEAPCHGTAYLLPPDQTSIVYRLYYTPEKDFCGVDAIGLCISDGCESITKFLPIFVANVNDPPEWDASMPTVVTVPVGEWLEVPLLAHDADQNNPIPDQLQYSLVGDASGWCEVSSADDQGTLLLMPGWAQFGIQSVTVQVFDGMVVVPWTIQVTVETPVSTEVSAALLMDPGLAPRNPQSGQERLKAYIAGCWENLQEGQWQLLSLPAEAEVASLCEMLSVPGIVIYDQQAGYRFCSTGVLSAGKGFWVRPQSMPTGTLLLQPASRMGDAGHFCGPVWLEDTPEGMRQEVLEDAWQNTDVWQVGKAYFLPPAEK